MDTKNLKTEWTKAKSALSGKSVGDQIKLMEAFVWEADEQTRPKLDQLLHEAPDMRETFLSRLAQKLPEQNFVFTEGNVRTLAALRISVEDQRKFMAGVVRSQTKKSIASAFETEQKTLLGTKEYLDRANKLGQYAQAAEVVLWATKQSVVMADNGFANTAKELDRMYGELATCQENITKARAERVELNEEYLSQETGLKRLEGLPEDQKTEDVSKNISSLRNVIILGLEKRIAEKDAFIDVLESTASNMNTLIRRLHDLVGSQQELSNAEKVRHRQHVSEAESARKRHEISMEDLRSMERLSKEVRNYRVTRIQQLYADLIATLPPVSEPVDYSQGKGYVLLRMYTILVSSLSEKRNNSEVSTATRELQVRFGLEQTGKINKALLNKLESFITGQQIAYANTLHIDA